MFKFACGLAALALTLAACGPGASELEGNLEITGMDPAYWGVKVDRAAQDDHHRHHRRARSQGRAAGEIRRREGRRRPDVEDARRRFRRHASLEACKDGLGEREYHWSALASWQGETLKGCAAATSTPRRWRSG